MAGSQLWQTLREQWARHWENVAVLLAALVFFYQASGFFMPELLWEGGGQKQAGQAAPLARPLADADLKRIGQLISKMNLNLPDDSTLGLTGSTMPESMAASASSKSARRYVKKSKPVLRAASIDLNQAGTAQLDLLPGVGPKIAQRILAYRKQHGAFQNLEDIKNVKGIGDKTYEKIQPYLVLR